MRATSRFAFIVGAPRCGTTTLASTLKQNPQVCFSSVKEPHYFSRHALGDLDDADLRRTAVGRERCHVVLFDDLAADPAATYRRMCEFLKIDPWPDTEFKARRINSGFRYGWLQRLLKRPPKAVRTVLGGEQFRQREKKLEATEGAVIATVFRLRKRLLDWNKVPAKRAPLDPELRAEIIARMRDEIIMLSQLIDRDLSHWLGGVPEANPHRD